jgi:hypothetical protein
LSLFLISIKRRGDFHCALDLLWEILNRLSLHFRVVAIVIHQTIILIIHTNPLGLVWIIKIIMNYHE